MSRLIPQPGPAVLLRLQESSYAYRLSSMRGAYSALSPDVASEDWHNLI